MTTMRQMFPSIRAQLTAWLALLTTLCLVAFAFYLYVAVSHSLTADLDRVLRVQAQQVAATYEFDAPESGDEEQDAVRRRNPKRRRRGPRPAG